MSLRNIFDSNLEKKNMDVFVNDCSVSNQLKFDNAVELTSGNGILLDGVNLKDGNILLTNGKAIKFGDIQMLLNTDGLDYLVDAGDTHDFRIDNISKCIIDSAGLRIDTIFEKSNNNGVNVDSVVCKDGTIGASNVNNTLQLAGGSSSDGIFLNDRIKTKTAILTDSSTAIPLNINTMELRNTTAGNFTATLANGVQGQILNLSFTQKGGAGLYIVTVSSMIGGFTTLTFNNIGDGIILQFLNGGWCVLGVRLTAVS